MLNRSGSDMLDLVRSSVIGDHEAVRTAYGLRRVTYADYTASGRALSFIEDVIREAVLPMYANTHTESSGTGLQTTRFREDARAIIRDAVGADPEDHVVLFTGSGSTAAIDRIITVLGLRLPSPMEDRWHLSQHIPADERPVVFIGPYEHHSNELPWRESIADVVTIHEDLTGGIDLEHLEQELLRYADRPLKIGSFSAASNVTGIISDVRSISVMLHRHGARSFWDFAAAAPYVPIEMDTSRPLGEHDPLDHEDEALNYKDAIFISTHKFVGGPGTPGILVARRDLFDNRVPSVPGGGTVAYVNPTEHRYLADIEHREEGGTPAIVESIRAGLVWQLKEAVGVDVIRERETSFIERAIARWDQHPTIDVLGSHRAHRLSIVSFVIRAPGTPARHLHHNFVVALLNDLFGIQARGGCSCAGPYGHRLLGIDLDTSHAFEREIARGCEGIKPGWVRINFNYFISEAVFEFLLDAVELVASDGWRLLDDYDFDPLTGLWRHHDAPTDPALRLSDVHYEDGRLVVPGERHHLTEADLPSHLEEARRLLEKRKPSGRRPDPPALGDDFASLRWFPLPGELLPS